MLCRRGAAGIEAMLEHFPPWLMWLGDGITWALYVSGGLLMLLIAAFTLGTLYELFGGIFFDLLVEHFEKKEYHHSPRPFRFGFALLAFYDTLLWAIRSLGCFLLCLLLCLLLPFGGQLILILAMGYHYGFSALLSANFYQGERRRELQQKAKGKHVLILGFGVLAYVLLMIPLASIFLLPGMILGGTMLYHEHISPGNAPDSVCKK